MKVTLIAAIASTVAAGGSFLTALMTYGYNKKKDKRSYAEKVAVWSNGKKDNIISEDIVIANDSSLPIYDVFVIGCINNEQLDDLKEWRKYYLYQRSVSPGGYHGTIQSVGGGMHKYMVLSIFFRDALGIEWFRNSNGILNEKKDYKEWLREKKIFPPY